MFNKLEARVLSEYKRSRAAPSTFCTLIKHYFSFIKHYLTMVHMQVHRGHRRHMRTSLTSCCKLTCYNLLLLVCRPKARCWNNLYSYTRLVNNDSLQVRQQVPIQACNQVAVSGHINEQACMCEVH